MDRPMILAMILAYPFIILVVGWLMVPFFMKLKCGFKLFEGHISWTTGAFLLTIIGWLPAAFAGKDYAHSVFYYSAPRITGIVFNLASLSLITSIVLSLCLLPKGREPTSAALSCLPFRRRG